MPIDDFPQKTFDRIGGGPVALADDRLYPDIERLHPLGPRVIYEILADMDTGSDSSRGLVDPVHWQVYQRLVFFHDCGPRVVFEVLDKIGQALLRRTDIDRLAHRDAILLCAPEARRR